MDKLAPPLPVTHPARCLLAFMGESGNPFLAPRGVFVSSSKLIVSDTGHNRVFIWNQLPETNGKPADVVLGQTAAKGTGRNANEKVSASTLLYPSGTWTDGRRLVVADAWNHRVLIWHSFPTEMGQPADVVVGQPAFTANLPNAAGIGKPPSAQTLHWPYGVWVHGEQLFIADTGNRRVLIFNELPKANFAAADNVIGPTGFTEKEYNPESAVWPYSVKVSARGEVAITDTQSFRVLYWASVEQALTRPAHVLFGQPDFAGNGQNQFRLHPAQNTLSWCYDAQFDKDGVWIADTGNSRLLWYPHIPAQHGAPAQLLIGHTDFSTGSENLDTIRTTTGSLYWPFALSISNGLMAVADTGNHRILFYSLPP